MSSTTPKVPRQGRCRTVAVAVARWSGCRILDPGSRWARPWTRGTLARGRLEAGWGAAAVRKVPLFAPGPVV